MIDAVILHLIWALAYFLILFPGAFLAWACGVMAIHFAVGRPMR